LFLVLKCVFSSYFIMRSNCYFSASYSQSNYYVKVLCSKTNLADDVQGAHEQLIQMPVLHQGGVASDSVLKHGPDLPLHLLLDIQRVT